MRTSLKVRGYSRRSLNCGCGAGMRKALEDIGEVSASGFGDAMFQVRLLGFGERHSDNGLFVVLDDFQVGGRILLVATNIQTISK